MPEISLKIEGMSCGMCSKTVTNKLQSINGVKEAKVELEKGAAIVVFDKNTTSTELILEAMSETHFTTTIQ